MDSELAWVIVWFALITTAAFGFGTSVGGSQREIGIQADCKTMGMHRDVDVLIKCEIVKDDTK